MQIIYIQLLDEAEQNIVIYQWRADQSFQKLVQIHLDWIKINSLILELNQNEFSPRKMSF